MAISNNLINSSLRKYLPSKVITGFVQDIIALESWLYDDGTGDPWWQGTGGAACRWILTADVFAATHSSHLTRVPNQYTGIDISPGMWVFATNDPRALRIVSIIAKSDAGITCLVEDVDRYNTFTDPVSSGVGSFAASNNLVFFELGDDGLPILNPLPSSADLVMTSQIESRFRVFNPTVENRFFQVAHGFKEGQVVRVDPASGKFVQATSNDIYIAGTVVASGPGPNYFYLSPSTKLIRNLEPGLPGVAGDIIWLDPITGDRTTIASGSAPLYVKLTNEVPAYTIGITDNPTTWTGTIIRLNNDTITFAGDSEINTNTIISAINDRTINHGVTASYGSAANRVSGSVSYPMTTPSTGFVFKLNGVTLTATLPSINFGEGGQLGWWDIIRAVNEQEFIHGVYASFDPNNGVVVFESHRGNDINFESISPKNTTNDDKTIMDMLGISDTNPASPANKLKLTRYDGGQIALVDVSGSFSYDMGIQGADNGSLPLALVVDKAMSANSMNMVADLMALNAITSPRSGDQVFVQNGKTPEEWELYVRTGVTWTLISDYDSAKTDASTMTVEVTHSSPSIVALGNMSNGTRIVNVTVVVSEAFSSTASLNVGTNEVVDAALSDNNIDLSIKGSYESNTTYIYEGVVDGELFVHIDSANSTSGKAKVIVSYL